MSDELPPTEDERCGTPAGSARHYRKGERQCEPCRIASCQYMTAYREANRESVVERGRAYREANRDEISRRKSARVADISRAFAPVAVHNGQAWTAEDDAIIRTTYDQPIVMVAAQLRRMPGAVDDRRAALRKPDRNQRKATA